MATCFGDPYIIINADDEEGKINDPGEINDTGLSDCSEFPGGCFHLASPAFHYPHDAVFSRFRNHAGAQYDPCYDSYKYNENIAQVSFYSFPPPLFNAEQVVRSLQTTMPGMSLPPILILMLVGIRMAFNRNIGDSLGLNMVI